MPDNYVVIEHEDGRSYAVMPEAFHRLYERDGFRIVGEETSTGSIVRAAEAPEPEPAPAPADVAVAAAPASAPATPAAPVSTPAPSSAPAQPVPPPVAP